MAGSSGRRLVDSVWLISLLTLFSRMLGVVRDSVSAAFFGAGYIWDAFSFAFRIPNLFRRLFGEGALNAAFIPIFAEYIERGDPQETGRMAASVAGMLSAVLLVLLAVGEFICLALLGVAALSEKWHIALALTAVMLPYSFLICSTAFTGGILNALRHFAAPAAAPAILNIVWILAVWLSGSLFESKNARVFTLAAAILVSGVLQMVLQRVALRKKGFRLSLRWEPRHEGLKRCLRMIAPIILGLAAFQLNVLLDGIIAIGLAAPPDGPGSFSILGHTLRFPMASGANSILYYADRLMQFPLGVFGIALATALFPTLATHAARKDWDRFSNSLREAVTLVIFIGLPATAGMVVLREPVVRLIFERGAFTPEMTARAARALLAYGCGIWAYCAMQVLVRSFYAVQDTVTPVRITAYMVGLNLVLNLALVWVLQEAGIAAATAVCAALQVVILTGILHRRGRLAFGRGLALSMLKTAIATVPMVPACVLAVRMTHTGSGTFGNKLLVAGASVAAGAAVFAAASFALRNSALKLLLRRR